MNRKIIIGAAFLLALSACEGRTPLSQRRSSPATAPVTVKVMRVEAGGGGGSSAYVGTVAASRETSIGSPAAGTLVSLKASEGRRVTKGEVLACIESQTARSAYDAAKARLSQAEDAWKRVNAVYGNGSVSDVDYIDMQTRLEEARAAEAAAATTLEKCSIKAPFSGVVQDIMVSEGIEMAPGEQLMRIIDTASPEVHFPLPEKEFPLHSVGDKARIEIPATGRSLSGVLSSKGVSASALSHSYECTVRLSGDTSGIMPGMVCKLYLDNGGSSSAVIPPSAVMTGEEGRYVWTVSDDGTVEKRLIRTGGYSGNGIVVLEGLEEGELIIVEGSRKVSGGMKANPVF